MGLYKYWMASSIHLTLFKMVAKLGFFPWVTISPIVLLSPCLLIVWNYWTLLKGLSYVWLLLGGLVLTGITGLVVISGLRYFPQKDAPVWIAVEPKYGVLGVHIWKQFPKRTELMGFLAASMKIALDLKFKTVRIESPLFVKDGMLPLWGEAIHKNLRKAGILDVKVKEVLPKKMSLARSLLFSVTRKLKGYDAQKKHLPKNTCGRSETAGFSLTLP